MGLENPTYINDLVETNPVGPVDFRSEGDDHIRNMKRAMKNTLPGMVGRAWRGVNRAASGALQITDNMTLQKCAAGITLTPDAAATLGNGWMCLVRAGDGSVTIDPGQNINGLGSLVVPQGYTCLLSCDGTEFFGILMFHAIPSVIPPFEVGTKLLFQQTSPPAGWTKQTNSTYNNAGLRCTTGVVGTGGLDDFTAVFGTGKSTNGHTLTVNQIPPHVHSGGNPSLQGFDVNAFGAECFGVTGTNNTGSAGGGEAHSHGLSNLNLKYVDFIVAAKD